MQELRRYKPVSVVNPKGKLVNLKQITDVERINRVYVINFVAALPSFAHNNLAPWQKLLDYHRLLEQAGKIDVNITVDHFQSKYIPDEIFQKPAAHRAKKKIVPQFKAKRKNIDLVKK